MNIDRGLHFGECENYLFKIPDNSVNMVCCDMPYGTTNCKWDAPLDLSWLWSEYNRVCKENAAIILFAQTPFDKVLGCSNLKNLRYEIIWEKTSATGHLNAKKMPMKAHENILVFYKKLPTYNPQKTIGHKPVNAYSKKFNSDGDCYGVTSTSSGGGNTDRYPRSVQIFSSDKQRAKLHPTQKPLSLIEWLIKTYTNEGDLVLDNCFGSGTTPLACRKLKRNFIGMEKDEQYFNIAVDRLLAHSAED